VANRIPATAIRPARASNCQIGRHGLAFGLPKGPSMSRPMISVLVLGVVTAAGVPTVPVSAVGAELVAPAVAHARYHYAAHWSGLCGCLHVGYVYHRELRTTYGSGFDPRNFDQTEPHYYFGPVRAYPRYWVDADPVQ
jgi:hypothetical protein